MVRVNRKNFGSFEAFIEKIEDLQYRANLCGRSHSQEIPNTAVPMRDVLEAVVKTLTTKEKDYLSSKSGRVLTALKEGMKNFQEDQRFFNYTTYATPKNYPRLGNETASSAAKPTSCCRYHKTTNHDSTECNYLARQKQQSNEQPKETPMCAMTPQEIKNQRQERLSLHNKAPSPF
jgi:hypothetical protein